MKAALTAFAAWFAEFFWGDFSYRRDKYEGRDRRSGR